MATCRICCDFDGMRRFMIVEGEKVVQALAATVAVGCST